VCVCVCVHMYMYICIYIWDLTGALWHRFVGHRGEG